MTTGLLQEYLAHSAQRDGAQTALFTGLESMSYAELERTSNRVAWALRDLGCTRGDRVCIFAAKTPMTIAAMLGVLKSGAAYVPVDIGGPVRRTAMVVGATDPFAVLTLGPTAKPLRELQRLNVLPPETPIVALDDRLMTVRDTPISHPESQPGDPAHILFTSGSTGRPKGVVVTHASVRAFIEWAVPYFGITEGERLSGHPPLHFDLSTFDVFATLKAGAELHLLPPHILLPRQLAQFISESRLEQLFCVPSAMTYLSSSGAIPKEGFPSLKRIIWCGEVLPTPVLIDWMRRVPRATFTNLYGPTEATIASSFYQVTELPSDERQPIPIGTPCQGEELVVLDDGNGAVEGDACGQLHIGGVGLSPGYWRAQEPDSQAFIADPRPGREGGRLYRTGDLAWRDQDGVFHFLGRTDTQVKCRGYRIELGEIEAAVGALPEIAECAVVGLPTVSFEGTSICCAAVARQGEATALTPTELRSRLTHAVPAFMVPARWLVLDVLPKNAHGKIDRRRIEELFCIESTAGTQT